MCCPRRELRRCPSTFLRRRASAPRPRRGCRLYRSTLLPRRMSCCPCGGRTRGLGGDRVKGLPVAAVGAPMALTLLIGAGFAADAETEVEAGVNVAVLPQLARDLLPVLEGELHAHCPELPALWVLAETQAESGWDPHAFSTAGAAGLLQLTP